MKVSSNDGKTRLGGMTGTGSLADFVGVEAPDLDGPDLLGARFLPLSFAGCGLLPALAPFELLLPPLALPPSESVPLPSPSVEAAVTFAAFVMAALLKFLMLLLLVNERAEVPAPSASPARDNAFESAKLSALPVFPRAACDASGASRPFPGTIVCATAGRGPASVPLMSMTSITIIIGDRVTRLPGQVGASRSEEVDPATSCSVVEHSLVGIKDSSCRVSRKRIRLDLLSRRARRHIRSCLGRCFGASLAALLSISAGGRLLLLCVISPSRDPASQVRGIRPRASLWRGRNVGWSSVVLINVHGRGSVRDVIRRLRLRNSVWRNVAGTCSC